MTPVQLPEVPAPVPYVEVGRSDGVHMEFPSRDYYTAAQLREYATEAVMAERRRLMGLVAEWRTEDMPGETVAFWLVADQLEERITKPEQNSER